MMIPRNHGATGRSTTRARLQLEDLEQRQVLSTLYLSPVAGANHYDTFQKAYAAAHLGDIIQIEPGATASSIGAGVNGHRLAGGAINTSNITIDNTRIVAGEWVQVNGGGGSEDSFVNAVQQNSPTSETLFFSQPLADNHTGGGGVVVTMGQLGIDKTITLQGDPNDPQAVVASPLETPAGASGLVFKNLHFTSPQGLVLDSGHQNVTVENSTLTLLQMSIGPGNASDTITGNTITGAAIINGDSSGLTADRVTNNKFIGSGSLYMINNGDSLVSDNTFQVSQNGDPFTAITIVNSPRILMYNNTVTINNADTDTTALFLWDSQDYPQSLIARVEDNVFDTAGKGVGLDTSGLVNAKVQGNDFRHNAVGVYLSGNGFSVGKVDLGGGSLGSRGLNNFSSFTPADTAKGDFAISLHNTSATDQVFAYLDTWSSLYRPNVVKDSLNNTKSNEAVFSSNPPGTGEILRSFQFPRVPFLTGGSVR